MPDLIRFPVPDGFQEVLEAPGLLEWSACSQDSRVQIASCPQALAWNCWVDLLRNGYGSSQSGAGLPEAGLGVLRLPQKITDYAAQ